MDHITELIARDAPLHASIPFWSWNDKLEDGELRRQIQNMKELGMRGFFMHARGGLETEYMSDEWFHAIKVCIDEARRLGLEAWAYDENGWPSGFAGGELLKDKKNQAQGLIFEELSNFPQFSEDILGVYVVEDNIIRRVSAPCKRNKYIVIRKKYDFSYVDVLNGEVTQKFISLVHQRYKREINGDDFGTVMPGFFTDEPQYFRYGTPWSDTLPTAFRIRFGYDVLESLPALFIDVENYYKVRYDYHLLCHERFYSQFMKPIYDWCTNNGIKLTGHGIEEWGLSGQMMCCGGVMPFYLYEHIPGIDYLGRGVKDISGARQLGSVCAQSGKKLALTETFACCGWDVTPRELKRITELQFAGGANILCEHLYPYSERGQRKRDFPNHYSEHNPWSKYFGEFERYFQNLGSALTQGIEIADTLVIHPIRSAYGLYKHKVHSVGVNAVYNDEAGITEQEIRYAGFTKLFSENQILYHFGDETVMKLLNSRVRDNKFLVGECFYDKVVLPYCECLDSHTVGLLRQYIANGGKILVMGDTPNMMDGENADLSFLQSNISIEELCKQNPIGVKNNGNSVPIYAQMRSTRDGKLIFVANTSDREYLDVELTVKSCRGLEIIDIATLKRKNVRGKRNKDGSVTVMLDFKDSNSYLLAESNAEMLPLYRSAEVSTLRISSELSFAQRPENVLLMDMAEVSLDGGISYSELRPIVRIKDNLFKDRFYGRLGLRYKFKTEFIPETLMFIAEPIKEMTVKVNGHTVTHTENEWRFDRSFKAFDIAKYVTVGENTAELIFDYFQRDEVYRVLYGGGNEALRNSLSFDTEIEAAYLYGDFCLRAENGFEEIENNIMLSDGDFTLISQKDTLDVSCINKDGYPFFAGEMILKECFEYRSGESTLLDLEGRFSICGVTVNGVDLGVKLFDHEFELLPYLHEGENELLIKVCFSNRNLQGPHHTTDHEPIFVTPRLFSFERNWNEDKCPDYKSEYSFVKFGIWADVQSE